MLRYFFPIINFIVFGVRFETIMPNWYINFGFIGKVNLFQFPYPNLFILFNFEFRGGELTILSQNDFKNVKRFCDGNLNHSSWKIFELQLPILKWYTNTALLEALVKYMITNSASGPYDIFQYFLTNCVLAFSIDKTDYEYIFFCPIWFPICKTFDQGF